MHQFYSAYLGFTLQFIESGFSTCYAAYAFEILNLNTHTVLQKYFPLKDQASKAGVYGVYLKI